MSLDGGREGGDGRGGEGRAIGGRERGGRGGRKGRDECYYSDGTIYTDQQ